MLYRRIEQKCGNIARSIMVRTLTKKLPLYVINEYPKSGGTWVGLMLAEAIDVPFPRNEFPVLKTSIVHGHYLRRVGMSNVVLVWRDGRDVMVSWYHHCLFKNERMNAALVKRVRKELKLENYEDVKTNLPTFMEYSFTKQKRPHFSWAEFVRAWYGLDEVIYVRYEDLGRETVSELQRVVRVLTGQMLEYQAAAEIAEHFSFASQAGREAGVERKNSFMRKGVVGDWVNYFSREAREVFDHYAGEELVLLGYEKDRKWALSL